MKVVEAHGSHENIGEKLGAECHSIAWNLYRQFIATWKKKGIEPSAAIAHSKKFLPYAETFYPAYIAELRGYANAIGIAFDIVFAWFCYDPPAPKGCTDMVFSGRATVNNCTYMVHNEDYDVAEENFAVLVKIYPQDAPAFIAMTYGGIWFNAGVNERCVGVAGNGLSHIDSRVGIPGDFAFRKTLSARTIGEAMEFSTPEDRSFSYCNIICDAFGEMYAMEGSATDFDAIHGRDYLVHTNHYLSPHMRNYDKGFKTKSDRSPGFYSDSIVRYNRAINLIEDRLLTNKIDVDYMKQITSDHQGDPWSICRHIDVSIPEHERSKTVFSEIIDVTARKIFVCKGNPCENEYVEYCL